ncbi:uncharacterized protein METZ01_LOCUS88564, partial [marine metagenome]
VLEATLLLATGLLGRGHKLNVSRLLLIRAKALR